MACTWLGFLYYYVRVGGDVLPMHRLFLPALPLQAVLAALGSSLGFAEMIWVDPTTGVDYYMGVQYETNEMNSLDDIRNVSN